MAEARIQESADAAVIFDPDRVGARPEPRWFDPQFWLAEGRVLRTPQPV